MQVYERIIKNMVVGRKMLAVLLDPGKQIDLLTTAQYIKQAEIDLVLVGGSGYDKSIDDFVKLLRRFLGGECSSPIVLFPGDICQFSPAADALLFISLISSNDPDLLIGRHIKVAKAVRESGIETIPMGYILIDGGRKSAVQRVTHTMPLSDSDVIVDTAVAGTLLGKRLIYLEAGSGARIPVSGEIIGRVRQHIDVPLIVGGGICTEDGMINAFMAGADIVVIGNYFERHKEQIPRFASAVKRFNEENKQQIGHTKSI